MQDVIVIEAGRRERNYWLDLWRYRELFRVLAWRDLSVRYKQTVIGLLWALIRPVLSMLVLTIIFGRIARLPSDGTAPYPLMVLAGILPWTFFSTGLSEASNSLINNANLISKVYFPRLIVPTATVVVALVDFIVQFGLYVSPVGFSSSVVPEQWRLLYSLNPMVGVIDGFRWCILGGQSELYAPALAMSIGVTAFLLWFGVRRFRMMEKSFADLI